MEVIFHLKFVENHCKALKGFGLYLKSHLKLFRVGGWLRTDNKTSSVLLVTKEPMQSFKIIALLLLGYFWLNVDFTPKYTIVGGQGGY